MEEMTELRDKMPRIITQVPGPKSKEMLKIKEQNVPFGVSTGLAVYAKQAQGAMIEDVDGNIFVDFAGGIGVMNVGHCIPEVVEVVKAQCDKFFHVNFNVVLYEQYALLAEKLNTLTPGSFEKRTMLVNTGAEANENAIKLARRFTGRSEIIAFTGGFHGRSYMTMALTSKVKPYKFNFGPMPSGVHRAEFPYVYRRPVGIPLEKATDYYLQKLDDMFLEEVAPDQVAAIILEPILGEGGFVIPPDEYIAQLSKICHKHGILLIADEVQTSYCRTGKLFATDYWAEFDAYPDILVSAKSIGAGMPISAVTARKEIFDSVTPGEIGGTYCGNPLAATAGLKVLEIMQREDYAGKANHIGEVAISRLLEMQNKYQLIGDVRGRGAMTALELVKDRTTKQPAKEETTAVIEECRKNGLIVLSAGVRDNIIRMLSPLVITDEQLNAGLDILENAIGKVVGQ
jgi:4-aminobutyrate aminotransferase / (S)-3-amino-2-methylpropionate transaminase / 5-aminovalerate transaminase